MKKGKRVEIELIHTGEVIPGIVERVHGTVAFVELSKPIHFMTDTKQGIVPSFIRPDMAEPMTDMLGYGTAQFLEDIHKLPPGQAMASWHGGGDGRLYKLEKPMKLKTIIDLCKDSEHRNEPHCWLQAAYLNVIPIKV